MVGRADIFRFAFTAPCVAALIAAVTATAAQSGSMVPLDIQGHRGARGLMPENSIPAFKKALALRVATLELDLQATRDRVLVVYHDRHLDPKRCHYDDGRPVPAKLLEELAHAELASIDCGNMRNPHFPVQQTVPGTRIPRLEDVLALAQQASYPVRLNIEIKWHSRKDGMTVAEFAEKVVSLIRQYKLEDRATVQSFYPPALRAVRDLAPDIPRAILVRSREEYDGLIESSTATVLSPRYEALRRGDVARFRDRGIPVVPWTVNAPADICRLIRWGVDGIITDYPDRVIRLYSENRCSGLSR